MPYIWPRLMCVVFLPVLFYSAQHKCIWFWSLKITSMEVSGFVCVLFCSTSSHCGWFPHFQKILALRLWSDTFFGVETFETCEILRGFKEGTALDGSLSMDRHLWKLIIKRYSGKIPDVKKNVVVSLLLSHVVLKHFRVSNCCFSYLFSFRVKFLQFSRRSPTWANVPQLKCYTNRHRCALWSRTTNVSWIRNANKHPSSVRYSPWH